jgi:hypothetical protein
MSDNTGFASYALYTAIRLHFTSTSYDFFKYNGKTNVTKDNFANRKDKYSFYKLSRKYSIHEMRDFFVANFLEKDWNWIGELLGPEGEENYKKWQKRNQSLTYLFKDDIISMCEQGNLDGLLKVENGNLPALLYGWMRNDVSTETVVILDDILNFSEMWNKKITDDIVWPQYRMKLEKYKPFLQYDRVAFRKTLKDLIKDYAET